MEISLLGSEGYETFVVDGTTIGVRPKLMCIKDFPPPTDREILTYNPYSKYESRFQSGWYDGEDFWSHRNDHNITNVTHWMPLPTPP